MTGLLAGVRVLDLSQMLSGPSMLLADHGAEVIKIEEASGVTSRGAEPFRDDDPGRDWAEYFVSLNRLKKSLVLDLKSEAGAATLRDLVRHADVLVESFAPGVMDGLGLSYDRLAAINPALVHAAVWGFGDPSTGANLFADWPARHVVAQAMGGLMTVKGSDADHPTKTSIGELFAGTVAGFGILAALRAAEATGKGQFLDLTMYDAVLSMRQRLVSRPVSDGPVPDGGADPAPRPPAIDPRALRNAFGAFATGVTVVTTLQPDGTPRGFTANSFSSVSLDPPLLLVCVAKSAHSAEVFASAPQFAVNILAEDQKAVSGLFASRTADKFQNCDWSAGPSGMPILTGALASFSCSRHRLVDAGDHLILIGQVTDFATSEGQPLGYFRGNYFSVGLEHDLVEAAAAAKGSRIGAVLAAGDGVLMRRDADGTLSLPLSPGPAPSLNALRVSLAAQGMQPEIDFVYAAFDDRIAGGHAIYYHGQIEGPAATGYLILPLADLTTAAIANASEARMLARFAADFRNGSFGIYHGNETTGLVRQVTTP